MIDIFGPLLFIIVPLLAVVFYGYLIINTIKRLFHNSLKIFPKIFFCLSAALPFAIIPVYFVLINIFPSPTGCLNLNALSSIQWRSIMRTGLSFVLLASPFLLLIIALILRRRVTRNERIIYTRALYILVFLIILIGISRLSLLNSARGKSIDASMRGSLSSIMTLNEVYFYDHNKYPIVAGLNAAERWSGLKAIYKQEVFNLPDSQCYKETQDLRYQYDYRSSDDGLRYVSTVLLLGPLKSNNPRLVYWCVDNTGVSKEINSLPGDNQFSCSK